MQCPICRSGMEQRDMAPCFVCGHMPRELEEFRKGAHTYNEYEVFPGHRMVLCDFCDADFGSYIPDYWGFPSPREMGLGEEQRTGSVESPGIEPDWFCPVCRYRLSFLAVRKRVREQNGILTDPTSSLPPDVAPAPGAPQTASAIPTPEKLPAPASFPAKNARPQRTPLVANPTFQFFVTLLVAPLCAIAGMSMTGGAQGKLPALLGWLVTFLLWASAAWRSVRHQWRALPRPPGRRVPILSRSLLQLRLLIGITLFACCATLSALILLAVLARKIL